MMYCTAGVRCERASAFLRNQGLQNVYQLDGGIHRLAWPFQNFLFTLVRC
jgi:predicted sulfurtransferase